MTKFSKTIFYLIWIVFPLGQLVRVQLSDYLPGLKLQPLDFLVFGFVFNWTVVKIKERKFNLPIFFKEMLVFAGIALFSLLVNFFNLSLSEFLPAFLYWARLVNFILFYPALVDFLKEKKVDILKLITLEGVMIGVGAILQYLLFPDLRFLYFSGWDEHYFRATGTFLDPSFTAIILVLSLLAFLIPKLKGQLDLKFWIGSLFYLSAIGLTFSRVAYVAMAIGTGLVLILKRKIKLLALAVTAFLIIVLLIPKPGGEGVDLLRTSSFVARADSYTFAWEIIKSNFVFGVGYNALRSEQYNQGFLSPLNWSTNNAGAGTDNSFLFVWATCGIFGLAAFVYLLATILKQTSKNLKKESSLFLFTAILTLIFASLLVNYFFYPWVLAILMLTLANFSVDSGE
jgi:O-antigen ligase